MQAPAAQPAAAINLDKKPSAPIRLGARLTASALKQHLQPSAKLWVNLPAPKELAAKLALHDSDSEVKGTADLARADYALTGVLTQDGPAYAWFHKSELVVRSTARRSQRPQRRLLGDFALSGAHGLDARSQTRRRSTPRATS